MNFRFLDSKQFKAILKALNEIDDVINFNISPEGLSVEQMDPSHIALVHLNMSKTAFEEWWVKAEGMRFALHVEDLLKRTFSKVKKDETVAVDIKDIQGNAVITLQAKYKRISTVPIMTAVSEKPPAPKMRFTVRISIIICELLEILEDVKRANENGQPDVVIRCKGEDLSFECDNFKVPLDSNSEIILGISTPVEEVHARYRLDILIGLVKAMKALTDVVTLEYSTNMPVKLTARLNYCDLVYYLAPRIEDEDR